MDQDEADCPLPKKVKSDETIKIIPRKVPVASKPLLDRLLDASLDYCAKEIEDQQCLCPECLAVSFKIILTDDAVKDCQLDVHDSIKAKCEKLVEMCALKLDEDSLPLLDLLAMVFDPNNEFHSFNATRKSVFVRGPNISDGQFYARPLPYPKNPRGWLVDLLNKFGYLGGFAVLFARFKRGHRKLTIPTIHALLQPFGPCYELLTVHTINKYFLPIVKRLQKIFDDITDEELKMQANTKFIFDLISDIIEVMKSLVSRLPQQENIAVLTAVKLKMTLKILRIFKNIPEPLAESIYNSGLQQLECFYERFQIRWEYLHEKNRKKLLGIIQRLAKDDKSDFFIQRVLMLFWNIAHSDGISTEKMHQALNAQIEILNSVCPELRAVKKIFWLDKCVEELKSSENWTLPALKQICDIYSSFDSTDVSNQENVLNRLKDQHNVMSLVANNLQQYLDKVRQLLRKNPETNERILKPDGWYNHVRQVEKRLDFVSFVADSGFLCTKQARQIWQCLVHNAVFRADRETCFTWFLNIITKKPPRDRLLLKGFLQQNILQVKPWMLTHNGIECFQGFFNAVNRDSTGYYNDDAIGINYLWDIIENSAEDIARRGYEILCKLNAALGSQSQLSDSAIHKTLLAQCKNRLQLHCEALSILTDVNGKHKPNHLEQIKIENGTDRMDRVLKFMREYNNEIEWEETED